MCIKGREEARGGFYYVKFWKSNGKKTMILLTNTPMAVMYIERRGGGG
jgi:hypothetical protein